jgi:uncharacterized protein
VPGPAVVAALVAIVLLAFVAEAAIGFGATVITVTLAALFLPLPSVLAAFVPINMALSAWLVVRNRRQLRLDVLLHELLPAIGVGVVVGLVVFRWQRLDAFALAFALFVVVLSIVELARGQTGSQPPLGPSARRALLGLGGFVHGLFGTGGPMIVYVLQRRGLDKGAFRATLALVWLVLNSALVVNFVSLGLIGRASASLSATFALALLPAMWLGERLHHRLSARRFQLAIFSLLLAAGLALFVRTALRLWTHP